MGHAKRTVMRLRDLRDHESRISLTDRMPSYVHTQHHTFTLVRGFPKDSSNQKAESRLELIRTG
jgi:hypothetical protein